MSMDMLETMSPDPTCNSAEEVNAEYVYVPELSVLTTSLVVGANQVPTLNSLVALTGLRQQACEQVHFDGVPLPEEEKPRDQNVRVGWLPVEHRLPTDIQAGMSSLLLQLERVLMLNSNESERHKQQAIFNEMLAAETRANVSPLRSIQYDIMVQAGLSPVPGLAFVEQETDSGDKVLQPTFTRDIGAASA